MNRRARSLGLGLAVSLAALLATGCNPPPANPPPVASNPPTPPTVAPVASNTAAIAPTPPKTGEDDGPVYHLDHAQTGLPKVKLLLGTQDVVAEVCISLTQVATGLMHRKGIGPTESMLFVFGESQRHSFYMKNVTFPIAAAYIDREGIIQEIVQLKAMDRTPVPSKSEAIQFVLETAPDWFERNGIAVGTQIVTDRGPLSERLAPYAVLK